MSFFLSSPVLGTYNMFPLVIRRSPSTKNCRVFPALASSTTALSMGLCVNVLWWCRASIHRSYLNEYGLTWTGPHVRHFDSVHRLLDYSFLPCVQIWSRIQPMTPTTGLVLPSILVDRRSGKWFCYSSSLWTLISRDTISRLVGNGPQPVFLFRRQCISFHHHWAFDFHKRSGGLLE